MVRVRRRNRVFDDGTAVAIIVGGRSSRRGDLKKWKGSSLSISLLLEMAVSGDPDRTAVVCDEIRWTTDDLSRLADGLAKVIRDAGAKTVAYIGTGGAMLPLLLFASARAGATFCPLNYRLSTTALQQLLDRLPDALVVTDPEYVDIVGADFTMLTSEDCGEHAAAAAIATDSDGASPDQDDTAVLLFTSGTTAQPKAVQLSHANLLSYITGTVEFASAAADDAALVSVPPYHVAGVGAALSNIYAGRTLVYLTDFSPREWINLMVSEKVTTATVVPTMLERIVSALEAEPTPLPALRNLAYGGSKVPLPLVRKALALLPDVGFANAYGLTETSSTIAVLTPQDHRDAVQSDDERVMRRLGSVGKPVPGIEVEIRASHGTVLDAGHPGELFVRGPQVSGRYADLGSVLDEQGWFATKDAAYQDDEGYLFIVGRADDTIIRGGENIAPAEVEDVLIEHPAVRNVAVVGAQDPEWGQIIVAVVVPEAGERPGEREIREWARQRLRGSRTPDRVVVADELPTSATGKVLRRELVQQLSISRKA